MGVASLVLLAAVLRAFDLDRMSLWTDEGLTFYRATKDLAFILSGRIDVGLVPTTDVQPPLYFLLLAGWFKLLGATPWVGKAFSLVVSLPIVPLVWALARRLAGRRAAWPAALFASVAPVYVWYAQEVRHYTLLVALAVSSGVASAASSAKSTRKSSRTTAAHKRLQSRKSAISRKSTPAVLTSRVSRSRRRSRRVRYSPWTVPTFADSTAGDRIDGDDLTVRRAAVEALGGRALAQ